MPDPHPDPGPPSRQVLTSRAARRAALLAERAVARQRRSLRGVTVRQLPVGSLPALRRADRER